MLTIGVIGIQGDISEHVSALENASGDLNCEIVTIKKKGVVPRCDGLVIPGGESTTIFRLLRFEGIDKEISTSTFYSLLIAVVELSVRT